MENQRKSILNSLDRKYLILAISNYQNYFYTKRSSQMSNYNGSIFYLYVKGMPVSQGSVKGVARVVLSLEDADQIQV